MTIEETLKMMASQQYPHKVDVVDSVMDYAMQHPYMQRRRTMSMWQRVSIVAAAAAIALVLVNVTYTYTRNYDEEGMGSMLAQVNDYSSWNTIEDGAVNPFEEFYSPYYAE